MIRYCTAFFGKPEGKEKDAGAKTAVVMRGQHQQQPVRSCHTPHVKLFTLRYFPNVPRKLHSFEPRFPQAFLNRRLCSDRFERGIKLADYCRAGQYQKGVKMTNPKRPISSVRKDQASGIPDLETSIRQRAFEIYEANGREDGHALNHWLQAESEMRGRQAESAAA